MSAFDSYPEFEEYMLSERYLEVGGGEAIAETRNMLGLKQAQLAKRVSFSRSSLIYLEKSHHTNGLTDDHLASLLEVFRDLYSKREESVLKNLSPIPKPSESQMKKFGSILFRDKEMQKVKWYAHYLTRRKEGVVLVRSILIIDKKGGCKLEYPNESLTYSGSVFFETASRILFILDDEANRFRERIVFRFDWPLSLKQDNIEGSWLGVHGLENQAHSRVLLTADPTENNISDSTIYKKISKIPPIAIDTTKKNTAHETYRMLDQWEPSKISKAILKSKPGDTLNFCSTYFPEIKNISFNLNDLRKRVSSEEENKSINVNILLPYPNLKGVLEARFRLLSHITNPEEVIIAQTKAFLGLAKKLSPYIKIDIRYHDTIPFGHYFKFEKVTFVSHFLPNVLATDGYMITLKDSASQVSQLYTENFDSIWSDNSENAEKYLKEVMNII